MIARLALINTTFVAGLPLFWPPSNAIYGSNVSLVLDSQSGVNCISPSQHKQARWEQLIVTSRSQGCHRGGGLGRHSRRFPPLPWGSGGLRARSAAGSARRQTLPPLLLLFVDDCNTNNTLLSFWILQVLRQRIHQSLGLNHRSIHHLNLGSVHILTQVKLHGIETRASCTNTGDNGWAEAHLHDQLIEISSDQSAKLAF